MTIVRRLARPLLATGYVATGIDGIRHSEEYGAHLSPALDGAAKASSSLAPLAKNPTVTVQALSAAQVAAGVLFGLGKLPRLSASVLVSTTAVNTYLQYRSTAVDTKEEKAARRRTTITNVSLVGAVLLAAVDTDGSPSLRWRADRLAGDVRKSAARLTKDTQRKVAQAEKALQDTLTSH